MTTLSFSAISAAISVVLAAASLPLSTALQQFGISTANEFILNLPDQILQCEPALFYYYNITDPELFAGHSGPVYCIFASNGLSELEEFSMPNSKEGFVEWRCHLPPGSVVQILSGDHSSWYTAQSSSCIRQGGFDAFGKAMTPFFVTTSSPQAIASVTENEPAFWTGTTVFPIATYTTITVSPGLTWTASHPTRRSSNSSDTGDSGDDDDGSGNYSSGDGDNNTGSDNGDDIDSGNGDGQPGNGDSSDDDDGSGNYDSGDGDNNTGNDNGSDIDSGNNDSSGNSNTSSGSSPSGTPDSQLSGSQSSSSSTHPNAGIVAGLAVCAVSLACTIAIILFWRRRLKFAKQAVAKDDLIELGRCSDEPATFQPLPDSGPVLNRTPSNPSITSRLVAQTCSPTSDIVSAQQPDHELLVVPELISSGAQNIAVISSQRERASSTTTSAAAETPQPFPPSYTHSREDRPPPY